MDEGGRPTLYARGSHRTLSYYSYIENIQLTRFSERYVRSRYEVVSLSGPKGGGFLLDTNGLHRARLDGDADKTRRTAVSGRAPLTSRAHTQTAGCARSPSVVALPAPFRGTTAQRTRKGGY